MSMFDDAPLIRGRGAFETPSQRPYPEDPPVFRSWDEIVNYYIAPKEKTPEEIGAEIGHEFAKGIQLAIETIKNVERQRTIEAYEMIAQLLQGNCVEDAWGNLNTMQLSANEDAAQLLIREGYAKRNDYLSIRILWDKFEQTNKQNLSGDKR